MSVWAGDFANDNWFSNTFSSNNTRSAVHEFGHALGLGHTNTRRNLMVQGASGKNITSGQRSSSIYNYQKGRLNKGSNSMMIMG